MLIHIGKCGGQNLQEDFINHHSINLPKIHLKKGDKLNKIKIEKARYICLLIRDPIKRFVSIFYFYKDKIDRKWGPREEPDREKLSKIFKQFETANDLALSLSDKNEEKKELALSFFNTCTHIVYGIPVYLPDDVIKTISKKEKVFVIKLENFEEDFPPFYQFIINKYKKENKMEIILNKKSKVHNTNKYNDLKTLSEKSISNLKKILSSDYEVLKKLYGYNLISEEYLNSLT